jgi:phytanoyl-CoA hydroxylase
MKKLNQDQIEFYKKNGYLIIKDFITEKETNNLKERMNEIINNSEITKNITTFQTNKDNHTIGKYFEDSSSEIYPFLEEESIDKEKNDFVQEKKYSINKVGHGKFEL